MSAPAPPVRGQQMNIESSFPSYLNSVAVRRLESKADMNACLRDVRFTPNSGHRLSLSGSLCAISRHQPASDWPLIAAPNPLHGLVFRHCNHGAGKRAVGLSQLIQNREVIGVGDRYQVAWDMP